MSDFRTGVLCGIIGCFILCASVVAVFRLFFYQQDHALEGSKNKADANQSSEESSFRMLHRYLPPDDKCRRDRIVDALNATMRDTGEDFPTAWSSLKRNRPELFYLKNKEERK